MKRMVGFLVVLLLLPLGCSDDEPASGPITIEVQLSAASPTGTFEVAEGSDVLGCVSGSYADEISEDGNMVQVTRVLTCESGEREGTFTIVFSPEPGPGVTAISAWTVTQATGGFTGLEGAGDMVMEPTETGATDTFTGDIEYGS